jgi:Zn finger protein HypA/HybF involved in hydrogenase expression
VPCYRCDRVQTDPVKGASPWAVAVKSREQVLVCPWCQDEVKGWAEELDRCPRCGTTRLKVTMGSVVCRACGHIF